MGSEAPSGGGSHSTTLKSNNVAIFHNFKHPPSSKEMMKKFSKKSLNQENLFIYLFLEIYFLIISWTRIYYEINVWWD